MRDRVHDAGDIDHGSAAVPAGGAVSSALCRCVHRGQSVSVPCSQLPSRPRTVSARSCRGPPPYRAPSPGDASRHLAKERPPAAPGCPPLPLRPAHPPSRRPARRSAPCGRSADGPSGPPGPPIMTWSSRIVDPEIPTCATITQPRPRRDVVPDLHQVVEARAGADHRVLQRATIDRAVGADLDVILQDDPAKLRHAVEASGGDGEAKTLLADARARIDIDPGTQQGVAEMLACAPIRQSGAEHDARHRSPPARRCGSAARSGRAPITASGPISADGIDARASRDHRGRMHRRGCGGSGWNSAATRAQPT